LVLQMNASVTRTTCVGDMTRFMRPVLNIARFLGLAPMVKVFTSGLLTAFFTGAGFDMDHHWQPSRAQS
jgi:hypothetical protein